MVLSLLLHCIIAFQIREPTTSDAPSSKPAADQSSSGPNSLMATLIGSDEFKNYQPSLAGVDPNKKVNVAGYVFKHSHT